MAKDYELFEGELGESAFMAGIVEILADWLLPLCANFYAFEADIFFVQENNLSLLDKEVKRRLLKLRKQQQTPHISEQEIERLKFTLNPVDTDVRQYVCDAFSRFSKEEAKNISANVHGFFANLSYYLREPLRIYEGDMDSKNEILKILGDMYMAFAFEYFFIAYDEWILLFMFGTFE